MAGGLKKTFEEAESLLRSFSQDEKAQATMETLAHWMWECLQSGGKILAAGNGGSLADAMHFAEEWTGRFRNDRAPLPAMALSDPTHLTCVANDYGFDEVFGRPVEAFAEPGDLVLLLSTSGKPANLSLAADAARRKGARSACLSGRGGGPLAERCDLAVLFPGATSDRIQELQMLALHALIEEVERRFGYLTPE